LETQSLFSLQEFVRRVLALNLPQPVWVSCELHQINLSRGHNYLVLVEKDEESDKIIAQTEGIIWQRTAKKLQRVHGQIFHQLLKEGMQVRLLASVDFHERYGYKLVIEDIDPTFTIGKLALERQANLEKLKAQGLTKLNKAIPLPLAIQHIAVISSPKAAGLQDFVQQLEHNNMGYAFRYTLFPAAVQGEKVEEEVIRQLEKIERQARKFHCVAIIRGGGARLDLAGFDRFALCEKVARFPLPVISGIGHETDESLLDMVTHSSLKTPTAVAEFLLYHNMQFEAGLEKHWQQLSYLASHKLQAAQIRLNTTEQRLQSRSAQHLNSRANRLQQLQHTIAVVAKATISEHRLMVHQYETLISMLSPEATFKRGYSQALLNDQPLKSAKAVKKGDLITTYLPDGIIKSKIEESHE
jgi:exodeoxyribonuclease VII large subunit